MLVNIEQELKSSGPFSTSLHPKLEDILAHGAWLDFGEIPVLNANKLKPRFDQNSLKEYFTKMLLSTVINLAWKQQNVYIMCFPMTQNECKQLNDSVHSDT